jgi:hypothetical protein
MVGDSMRVAIGSDHAGFELKELVKPFVVAERHEVLDVGTYSKDPGTIRLRGGRRHRPSGRREAYHALRQRRARHGRDGFPAFAGLP